MWERMGEKVSKEERGKFRLTDEHVCGSGRRMPRQYMCVRREGESQQWREGRRRESQQRGEGIMCVEEWEANVKSVYRGGPLV